MAKKKVIPDDQKQPTLKESAQDAFERTDIKDHTKDLLKKLPLKKESEETPEEKNLYFKKIKEEIAKKLGG